MLSDDQKWEDQKRLLTETLLKEEWHTHTKEDGCISVDLSTGWIKEKLICRKKNRTFDTWQDLGDVKDALVKEGLWSDFYMFATIRYKDHFLFLWKDVAEHEVSCWLFNPTDNEGKVHFCHLVAEFLEKSNNA